MMRLSDPYGFTVPETRLLGDEFVVVWRCPACRERERSGHLPDCVRVHPRPRLERAS